MKFDRKKFFDAFRQWRGSINQQQVSGITFLLDAAEQDPHLAYVEWLAYMLATVKLETADTYKPIHEYGGKSYFIRRYGGQTRKGRELGNDTPEEGAAYAGQGFVQLTGESNYEKSEAALRREYPALVADFERRTGKRFDLTVGDQPNDWADSANAQDPKIAYAIMSFGMRTGLFTGRKLSDYIYRGKKDYANARRIINGTDKAETIAAYAKNFEAILKRSLINDFNGLKDSEIKLEIPAATSDTVKRETNLIAATDSGESASSQISNPLVSETSQTANQSSAPETSEQATEETQASTPEGETQIKKTLNEQDVNKPAEVEETKPYNGIGFWATIKRDLTAVTGGNLTFQGLSEYAQQANNVPAWLVPIVGKIALVILIASVGYLLFRVIHYLADSWKQSQRVKVEAEAKTSVTRKDIIWK